MDADLPNAPLRTVLLIVLIPSRLTCQPERLPEATPAGTDAGDDRMARALDEETKRVDPTGAVTSGLWTTPCMSAGASRANRLSTGTGGRGWRGRSIREMD